MSRTTSVSLMLAAMVALVATPPATAKLPPGSRFKACGESGCKTATGAQTSQLELKLIEAAAEHGTPVPPVRAAPWTRVDLTLDAVKGGAEARSRARRSLGWVLRSFPVVFLPGHRYIGVPASGGSYRWFRLRPLQIQAYNQLGGSVRPFPQRRLAGLNQSFVSRAKSDGTRATVGGDSEGGAVRCS
jgi:hypothetical protein